MKKLKKMPQWIVVLVLLSFYANLYSVSDIRFYNLNKNYGISIRDANEICTDDYGFVWASSRFGILRFTMEGYRIYKLPYVSTDVITVNLTYKNSTLYAYTNNGQIFIYNPLFDRFDLVFFLQDKFTNIHFTVSKVLIDAKERLWIATSIGLYYYEDNELYTVLNNKNISYLTWYNEKAFFYAIKSEIFILDLNTLISTKYYSKPEEDDFIVSKLFYDRQLNQTWVGTVSHGLFQIKQEGDSIFKLIVRGLPAQPVLALESNTDSTLVAGIDGQGIWEINKESLKILNVFKEDINNINSLQGNGVYDLFRDNNNRIWICSISGGVSFFDQENSIIQNIRHITNNQNSLINNDVKYVLVDSDGNVWFATNNGISFWNTATNKWRSYYNNKKDHAQVFLALCEDKEGRIWAGSYSSGIYILDRKSGKELKHLSNWRDNYECNFVFDIYKDSEGDIWLGDVKGNSGYFCSKSGDFVALNDKSINVIAEYKEGQIILGMSFGVSIYDKHSGQERKLIDDCLVSDIYVEDSIIWICTIGDGLIKYNIELGAAEKFKECSGLPSDFVNSIDYFDGYLWIGTENGLCRLNPENNNILTLGSLGISNISFNYKSKARLKNGKMIWGTNNGAYIFNSDIIKTNQNKGKIFLEELMISGRSIRDTSMFHLNSPLDSLTELTLNYTLNTISLELLPLNVSFPGSKFSWKLDGYEDKWSQISNNRILTYTNIPSGDYSLRIRMYDNSSKTILDERSITLNIIPPFWETWWFRISLIVFIVGVILVFIAFYIDRLKKEHSEEKIRFFTNTAHDIRTSLTLINAPIEELNKEKNLTEFGTRCLATATEQVQQLSSVVNQLMDFQKADIGKEKMNLTMSDLIQVVKGRTLMFESYARKQGITLIFSANQDSYLTAIDENIIEKVVDNLISNSIKYSQGPDRVEIILECTAKKWILDVRDYGLGISKKAQKQLFKEFYRANNVINSKIVGSGIGLLLVKNYVTLHGGTVSCFSQKKVGSTFRVEVPYKSSTEIPQKKSGSKMKQQKEEWHDTYYPKTHDAQDIHYSSSRMKVLIVEDHEALSDFLRSALQREFEVVVAENGAQAWKLIKKSIPDLVVSDIMMPKMDGFELCQKIKSTFETSHIPVILLTALTGKAEKLHGMGIGADDYLTKPFDLSLLQQRIRSIIQNREVVKDKALKMIKLNSHDSKIILENELNDQFIKKMSDIVRANISNPEFNKNSFAASMNVSPSLLYKKVKALTDQSPTDFIKSIRMDYAVELIQSGKYTITEVSELSGFSSIGYFSTVFKKYYNKLPTEILVS